MDPRSLFDYSPDHRLEAPVSNQPAITQSDRRRVEEASTDPLQRRMLLREPKQTKLSKHEARSRVDARELKDAFRDTKIASVQRDHERPKRSRRPDRSLQPSLAVGLQIRPEERRLLKEVGKFRVISTDDLGRFVYGDNTTQLRHDLEFLKNSGLVETHVLNARRDGKGGNVRRFEAVTLTKPAKKLLERSGELPDGQRIYSGLVKAREAEHDSQIYRAYLKELTRIERQGGTNPRVKLDFELKANVHRESYRLRKSQPDRDIAEIKEEVARQHHLAVIDNKIVFPDARVEYELPGGTTSQVDIEVATSAYRHGHIAGKSQAGFRIYISDGDIGRLGAGVQDDHDIMSEILDF